jgi:hypothetical protein
LSTNESASAAPVRWPNIAALLVNGGHITVGKIAHIESAAIAADEHTLFATVVRRSGESLEELLQRLDVAVGRALKEGVYTNEVEGGSFMLATPTRKRKPRKSS